MIYRDLWDNLPNLDMDASATAWALENEGQAYTVAAVLPEAGRAAQRRVGASADDHRGTEAWLRVVY